MMFVSGSRRWFAVPRQGTRRVGRIRHPKWRAWPVVLRVINVRNDNHHKATTAIAKTAGRVVVETLNVAGMIRNRRLARAIADAGMLASSASWSTSAVGTAQNTCGRSVGGRFMIAPAESSIAGRRCCRPYQTLGVLGYGRPSPGELEPGSGGRWSLGAGGV